MFHFYKKSFCAAVAGTCLILGAIDVNAQSTGNSTVAGTVLDPSGAVVVGANVEMRNPVSGYSRNVITDALGKFSFPNVPYNPYHLTVTKKGFASSAQDVDVRSVVPTNLTINLSVTGSSETVTVEAAGEDLLENDPTFHTDVDRDLFDKIPLESASSSVSSLITLASPGVAADSNGLFHGIGDHAENSFSLDGQPITDQQSKVFSNQIPLDSIQSMEAVSGGPPAEFGDKTSLVIKVTTKSGLGAGKPTGSVYSSYGSFGSVTAGFRVAMGKEQFGNFIAANGLNTSRFLDPPELHAIHDQGNEENLFDRFDYAISGKDSVHVNFQYTRSWFQTPNTIDNLNIGLTDPVTGAPLPAQDQRAQIATFNIAPVWTRLISPTTLLTVGAFVRRDHFNYYPSANVFADGTGVIPGGSSATLNQDRKLTNTGLRADLSYVKGAHNIKVGGTFQHTLLTEDFKFGITDPNFLRSQVDSAGNPCFVGGVALDSPCTDLLPFDLTQAGNLFPFHGHTDVKELALYAQDTINEG